MVVNAKEDKAAECWNMRPPEKASMIRWTERTWKCGEPGRGRGA